jgi:hypothetical protein
VDVPLTWLLEGHAWIPCRALVALVIGSRGRQILPADPAEWLVLLLPFVLCWNIGDSEYVIVYPSTIRCSQIILHST